MFIEIKGKYYNFNLVKHFYLNKKDLIINFLSPDDSLRVFFDTYKEANCVIKRILDETEKH